MKIEIAVNSAQLKKLPLRLYDKEEDDIRSILIDICHSVENHVNFCISGFGQDYWPVDTRTDLAVFLEQLPEAIVALKNRSKANIDFYEQGIERYLTISPPNLKNICQISCISQTNWQPNPEAEEILDADLLKMLIEVKNTFMTIVMRLSPNTATHPWIVEWNKT